MTRPVILALLTVAACAALVVALPESRARTDVLLIAPDDAEARLARAARESRRAEQRVARLTREAEAATEAAERVAAETAALAAQIQQTEADIEVARAQLTITRAERAELTARLAEQQEPTARLAAALQTASRRPLALSALQPGSLKEVVYVRAVLDSAVPQIRARTANLRAELDKGRMLEAEAAAALESLRDGEQALRQRRAQLAALENRQRVASRTARGAAVREAERALALAEEARDLDGLVARLDDIAALRRELAALPGPVLRARQTSPLLCPLRRNPSQPPPVAPSHRAISSSRSMGARWSASARRASGLVPSPAVDACPGRPASQVATAGGWAGGIFAGPTAASGGSSAANIDGRTGST